MKPANLTARQSILQYEFFTKAFLDHYFKRKTNFCAYEVAQGC